MVGLRVVSGRGGEPLLDSFREVQFHPAAMLESHPLRHQQFIGPILFQDTRKGKEKKKEWRRCQRVREMMEDYGAGWEGPSFNGLAP